MSISFTAPIEREFTIAADGSRLKITVWNRWPLLPGSPKTSFFWRVERASEACDLRGVGDAPGADEAMNAGEALCRQYEIEFNDIYGKISEEFGEKILTPELGREIMAKLQQWNNWNKVGTCTRTKPD